MRVELHCHSTYSDGSEPAEEVARMALARGVELFCLTDHDTCAGYPATVEVFAGTAVRVLRGVELSCHEDGRTVHLLMYDTGGDWSVLDEALAGQGVARRRRLRDMAARLEQLGVGVDIDAILEGAGDRTVGRPDLARALHDAGHVKSTGEAFARYLHDGGPADVSVRRLTVDDGLALARAAGARVSLAHPDTIGTLARPLVERCRAHGLGAVEAWYGAYPKKDRRRWRKLADELGVAVTAGSDYHGRTMPRVACPGIDVPDDLGAAIVAWLDG